MELKTLKDSCHEGDMGETKELLKELNELQKRKKNSIMDYEHLQEEYYNLANEQKDNIKKIERKYYKVEKANGKINRYNDQIEEIKGKLQHLDVCETEISPRLVEIKQSIKDIFSKLLNAKTHFPDIYSEIERKLNIYVLTPP
ncbi:MAG: hypothetical protein ACFFCS_02160 [Candidatus Hodarchaeota archaeon]